MNLHHNNAGEAASQSPRNLRLRPSFQCGVISKIPSEPRTYNQDQMPIWKPETTTKIKDKKLLPKSLSRLEKDNERTGPLPKDQKAVTGMAMMARDF